MWKRALSLALSIASAPGIALTAAAQETDFMGTVPSVEALVRALQIEEQTRAIVPEFTLCSETRGIEVLAPKSVVLDIKFEFDSAVLTSTAREILDRLGTALARDELAQDSFLVEGHTDARGPEAYNLALSERRAVSVGRYLREQHGVAPDRLSYACKGETELLDRSDPESAVNRRVEVRNLGRG